MDKKEKQITAIKVIGLDFNDELKDFCVVLFYNGEDVIDTQLCNLSFRDFMLPLFLKKLHEEYNILPEFEIKKGDE